MPDFICDLFILTDRSLLRPFPRLWGTYTAVQYSKNEIDDGWKFPWKTVASKFQFDLKSNYHEHRFVCETASFDPFLGCCCSYRVAVSRGMMKLRTPLAAQITRTSAPTNQWTPVKPIVDWIQFIITWGVSRRRTCNMSTYVCGETADKKWPWRLGC